MAALAKDRTPAPAAAESIFEFCQPSRSSIWTHCRTGEGACTSFATCNAMFLSVMVGPVRNLLDTDASRARIATVREHVVVLTSAYLSATFLAR